MDGLDWIFYAKHSLPGLQVFYPACWKAWSYIRELCVWLGIFLHATYIHVMMKFFFSCWFRLTLHMDLSLPPSKGRLDPNSNVNDQYTQSAGYWKIVNQLCISLCIQSPEFLIINFMLLPIKRFWSLLKRWIIILLCKFQLCFFWVFLWCSTTLRLFIAPWWCGFSFSACSKFLSPSSSRPIWTYRVPAEQ